MTPEEFVEQVRRAVVEQIMVLYKELFESTTPEAAINPHWKRAVAHSRFAKGSIKWN